jgi:hypothetical protein
MGLTATGLTATGLTATGLTATGLTATATGWDASSIGSGGGLAVFAVRGPGHY